MHQCLSTLDVLSHIFEYVYTEKSGLKDTAAVGRDMPNLSRARARHSLAVVAELGTLGEMSTQRCV
jgi:hypothetical protein